jgi:hypothetical protein
VSSLSLLLGPASRQGCENPDAEATMVPMHEIGDIREAFCEIDEKITRQRLIAQGRSGSSEVSPPRKWWCLDGDHLVGKRPEPRPPLRDPA